VRSNRHCRVCRLFVDGSFAIAGPRTWNNLPDAIRDLFYYRGTFDSAFVRRQF